MDKLEQALEKSRQQRAALSTAATLPSEPVKNYASSSFARTTPAHELPQADVGALDEKQMEHNRIVAHHTQSAEADIYKHLRTKVLHIMKENGYRTLAITSPHYGDGKTTVAINLGISMAMDVKQTVLLVDLDLRKPNLHTYLGVVPQAGLTDYLLDGSSIPECLLKPPFDRVRVLPAGKSLENSSELLGSPKMIALARELKNRYTDRIVIYDMPPVLLQDDPIAFLPQVDAVLVVVRDGMTTVDDLKRCLKTLEKANVIGTVLNNCW